MNSLVAGEKENAEKRTCIYCNRVFCSPRALGGHLRAHKEEIKARSIYSNPVSLRNAHPFINSGFQFAPVPGYNFAQFGGAAFPQDLSPKFPNQTSWTSGSQWQANGNGFPLVHSSCQFNTHEFQAFQEGFGSFGNALPNPQGYYFKRPASLPLCMSGSGPILGSNHGPGVMLPTSTVSISAGSHPCSGHDDLNLHNPRSFLTSEQGEKRCLSDDSRSSDLMHSFKKPKIMSNTAAETEKMKEKAVFANVKKSFSAQKISVIAGVGGSSLEKEEEDPMDLDLSLHL